jgi:hypothetical protein
MKRNRVSHDWNTRFTELREFIRTHGTCDFQFLKQDNRKVLRWAISQRNRFGFLPLDQLRKLCDVGFDFGNLDRRWLSYYWQLVKFKQEHGHAKVPLKKGKNTPFAAWTQNQRPRWNKLSINRRMLLDRMGFDWTPTKSRWMKQFTKLVEFRNTYGHCNPPRAFELAKFVQHTRERKDRLSQERVRLLDAIGFEWSRWDAIWNRRFDELKEFKSRFGHSNVPENWPENRGLANWVSHQRARRKMMSMPPERIKKLNSLGFKWSRRSDAKIERFG